MTIPHAHGYDFYTPFYLLATLTNVVLLLWEGWRRGFPLRPWLALVAASSLALILGAKLITHPIGEWATLLFTDAPADTARSILGGSLAAVLTAVALRRWLGLSRAVLDALALPLCGALVVQCLGCVLTGCCFGEPTTGFWGLTYAAGTLPWATQVQAGLLPATAAHSLPVAPTQLLALLLCAAVGGVLLAVRRRRWPVGSWLLLQTGLLLLGRVALSFWRDPAGEPVAGSVHPVLGGQWSELQLLLLPLALLALGVWAWRVYGPDALAALAPTPAGSVASPTRTVIVAVTILGLSGLLGQQALTLPEVLVVRALLLVVLVAESGAFLATIRVQGLRLAGLPLSLAVAGLVLLTTAQAPAPGKLAPPTEQERTTVLTGGVLSNYHEAEGYISESSGCSGQQRLALQQQVRAAGGEVAIETRQPSGRVRIWGGGVWAGQQRIDMQLRPDPDGNSNTVITDRDTTLRKTLVDVHVYREFQRENDWRSYRLRVGVHMGQLGYFTYFDTDDTRSSTVVMPELMVRMGKPSVLYGQADLCYGAENAMGAYTSRLSLGSGLGSSNGSGLQVGYAHSPHSPTSSLGFVSALLLLPGKSGVSIEPYYATDLGRHNNFSMRLNYRLSR
ncbi:prolipoprotein diacylglyceryl transferase family protein [Hymenobacter sp. IS2118]|uniref:prolipoprotein diacylglyceryl transferase family protein n=1 Tax=Hymenobacter sp. IS2118 TaxID=1505605 RepID=UPI0005543823|nr:prolipoprotein diacylglyceryl transferase family protein [Hymenobacter sp. IS2118]